MNELQSRPWPSIDGPSIFSADRKFQTAEFKLYLKAISVTAERLDWHDFRVTYEALGHKEILRSLGAANDD